ncbi:MULTISPECIES: hypothetical protein [Rhizobium]|uniref:hypothetical protein n=1 Tax=Rhizobium TaxID=379 RepID=UPI0007EA30EA|nr:MULTISPECIES: hypothetical protein [Rhizobium]ANK94241.1 hypothetical protein AMK01_PB00223 [Rhizobium sp. N6212]ANL00291.1 hypothetical protein AMK00_PB00222 [Rhizobium sp. N621]ANL06416.1 hypothetical protein AMJ99_PB00218 [Rhizobium esperanzae]ANL12585.1 hypothetical protein AMJ98_PC00222 [Rhizobium sp. N1341]ANL24553.1 hypothetical protein AMJ96_PB00238 [Rhizobium sp. N113]
MKYLYHSASRNCDQGAGGAKISVLDLGVTALLCRAGSRLEALLAERGRLEQQSKPFTMLEGVSLLFAFGIVQRRDKNHALSSSREDAGHAPEA